MSVGKDEEIVPLVKDSDKLLERIACKDQEIDSLSKDIERHLDLIASKDNEIYSLSFEIKVQHFEILALRQQLNNNHECSRIHEETMSKLKIRKKNSVDVTDLLNTACLMEANAKKLTKLDTSQESKMVTCEDKEIDSLLGDIDHHSKLITRKDKEIDSLLKDIEHHSEMIARKDKYINTLSSDIDHHTETIACKDKEIKSLLNDNKVLKDEISEQREPKNQKLNHIREEKMRGVSASQVEYERKITVWRNREAKDADKINALMKEVSDLKAMLEKDQKAVYVTNADGRGDVNESKPMLKLSVDGLVRSLKDENDKLKAGYSELAQKSELLRRELAESKNLVEELKDNKRSNELQEKYELLQRDFSEANKVIEQLKDNNRSNKLGEKYEVLDRELAEANKVIEELKDKKRYNEEKSELLIRELAEAEKIIEESNRKMRHSEEKSDLLAREHAEAKKIIEELKGKMRFNELEECLSPKKELAKANKTIEELKDKMRSDGLEEKYELLRNELDETKNSMEELKNTRRRELRCLQSQFETQQHNNEKLKRDLKNCVDKINELKVAQGKSTAELARVNKLVEESNEKLREKDLKIAQSNIKLKENDKFSKVENCSEEVTILRMQLEAYQKDFQEERDAREKQQGHLEEQNDRIQILMRDNYLMKADIEQRSAQDVGKQSQHQRSHSSIPFKNIQGTGNEQHYAMQSQQQQNKQYEFGQRICPKCNQVYPDVDTLQIHIMECLDT